MSREGGGSRLTGHYSSLGEHMFTHSRYMYEYILSRLIMCRHVMSHNCRSLFSVLFSSSNARKYISLLMLYVTLNTYYHVLIRFLATTTSGSCWLASIIITFAHIQGNKDIDGPVTLLDTSQYLTAPREWSDIRTYTYNWTKIQQCQSPIRLDTESGASMESSMQPSLAFSDFHFLCF